MKTSRPGRGFSFSEQVTYHVTTESENVKHVFLNSSLSVMHTILIQERELISLHAGVPNVTRAQVLCPSEVSEDGLDRWQSVRQHGQHESLENAL